MKKIGLIFSVTGQDGAYLSKLLLKKIYSSNCNSQDCY